MKDIIVRNSWPTLSMTTAIIKHPIFRNVILPNAIMIRMFRVEINRWALKRTGAACLWQAAPCFLFQGRLVYDVRCYRLMDSDLPGFVLIWFGDPQLQDTVFVIGGNFFGIHIVGKVEAPFKTAERAFASIIALFLDFIVR